MTTDLGGLHIGFIERRHPPGNRGSLVDKLVPLLRECGAQVAVVHAEEGLHVVHTRPVWDIVVLKSGSAAALRLAAVAEAWDIPSINTSDATRLAQDKLASTAILQTAGLPIASARLAWLGSEPTATEHRQGIAALADRRLIVKAARGSQGQGLWTVAPGELLQVAGRVPAGPYLLMDWIEHDGHDLKVFVAGDWMTAIERPFPARTLEEKRGQPVDLPAEVATIAREAGALLGLACFGCDFVRGASGWRLVDANAFPGFKGADGAPLAIVNVVRAVVAHDRSVA